MTLKPAAAYPHRTPLDHHVPLISVLCALLGGAWSALPHPFLIVIVCALPLALMVCLSATFLMVLGFVIFSFFRIHEAIPALFPLKIPLLLSLASLFALGWHVAISRKLHMYWRPELTAASLFFGLVTFGVVAASNFGVALAYFKGVYWKIMLMTFAITFLTRRHTDFARCSMLAVLAGCVVGVVALLNKANGIGLVEETRVTIGRELGSVLGDPNDLALVLMFPIAFAVGMATNRGLKTYQKIIGLAGIIILFMAVIATQSRGGLLGILTVFGIFGYRKIKSKILLGSIGTVFAIFLFVFAGISDRQSGGAAEEGIDASAQGRLYAWEAAYKMALHNPLSGVGIDNFYSNYYFYSSHWDGLNHAVHSTWFGVLAETGFLGLGVFVSMIITLLRSAYRSLITIERHANLSPESHSVMRATAESLVAGMLGTIVSGTFLTQGFTWPIYILAALIAALAHWVETHCAADGHGTLGWPPQLAATKTR